MLQKLREQSSPELILLMDYVEDFEQFSLVEFCGAAHNTSMRKLILHREPSDLHSEHAGYPYTLALPTLSIL